MLTDHRPCPFVAVRDIEEAEAFYAGVLGLESHGFDGFALRLRAGPVNMRLVKLPEQAGSEHTVLGWETDDIARDVAALVATGVTFLRFPFFGEAQDSDGIWSAPGGDKVAWFKDPSGNTLSLAQHAGG